MDDIQRCPSDYQSFQNEQRTINQGHFSATEIQSFDFGLVVKGSFLPNDSLPLYVNGLYVEDGRDGKPVWPLLTTDSAAEQVIAASPGVKSVSKNNSTCASRRAGIPAEEDQKADLRVGIRA